MILILSDLHLGDGGPLEDFLLWGPAAAGPIDRAAAREALDASFARLLATRRAHAAAAAIERPRLVLLGDTFDLWQAQRRGEPPRRALARVLEAHPAFESALRGWLDSGARLDLVVGNHDQPLVHPDAWSLLAARLPGLNASGGGGPAHSLRDEAAGLYAEHGHRWDPWNRVRRLDKHDADPAGRRVVRRLVNRLEPAHPWIDKAGGVAETLALVQDALLARAIPARWWREALRAIGGARRLAVAASPWARRRPADFEPLRRDELRAMNRGIARATAPAPRGTTGPLPARLRFFASGHTHEPLRAAASGGAERLNPGAWKPRITRGPDGRMSASQDLPYLMLAPDGDGGHEASLRRWAQEDAGLAVSSGAAAEATGCR